MAEAKPWRCTVCGAEIMATNPTDMVRHYAEAHPTERAPRYRSKPKPAAVPAPGYSFSNSPRELRLDLGAYVITVTRK